MLPQEYKETASGAPFLVYDSGAEEDRMLIFASAEFLQLLTSSEEWYSDGTFKTVPEQFFQLYTLHGVCGEKIVPCVFCLMPNKTEATYVSMLQKIKENSAAATCLDLLSPSIVRTLAQLCRELLTT